MKKTRTTALHPQSDGQVERQYQTILNYLAKFISKNQKDWNRWIPLYLLAYRSSKHETTGMIPAEVYFAQDLFLRLICYAVIHQKLRGLILRKITRKSKKKARRNSWRSKETNRYQIFTNKNLKYNFKARQIYFKERVQCGYIIFEERREFPSCTAIGTVFCS